MRTEPSAAAENRRAGRIGKLRICRARSKKPDLLRADLTAALENEIDRGSLTLLHNAENVERAALLLRGQRLPGLTDEVRHIDHGQRIGAFQYQCAAERDAA